MDDFETVRVRLLKVAPDDAKALGIALSRSRFVARGTDGVEAEGLKALADAFDAVLDGYADVFGLTNFSKVPGKKLRLRAHLVPVITKPPHFAPQFAWHSEIDFPVVDARGFSSPTEQGQFLFYGLCHELGHVIAMWGDTKDEEDRHAWAHYTGVVLVEELSKRKLPALEKARDGKWRSLAKEREELVKEPVEAKERERWKRMKAFVGVHDLVGARAVGEAINAMEAAGKVLRVNRVRYYRVGDFEEAVCATEAGRKKVKELRGVIGGK